LSARLVATLAKQAPQTRVSFHFPCRPRARRPEHERRAVSEAWRGPAEPRSRRDSNMNGGLLRQRNLRLVVWPIPAWMIRRGAGRGGGGGHRAVLHREVVAAAGVAVDLATVPAVVPPDPAPEHGTAALRRAPRRLHRGAHGASTGCSRVRTTLHGAHVLVA
jgi:hypothetical protein